MLFREKPESPIDSPNKLALLKYFFSEREVTASERELARIVGISSFSAHVILKELENANLLEKKRVGKSSVWQLRKESYYYFLLRPIFAQLNEFSRPIEHLKRLIKEKYSKEKVSRIVLYGSIAEGNEEYNSDIDLLIILGKGANAKEIEHINEGFRLSCMRIYGNNVHFIVMNEKEYRKAAGEPWMESVKRGMEVFQRGD